MSNDPNSIICGVLRRRLGEVLWLPARAARWFRVNLARLLQSFCTSVSSRVLPCGSNRFSGGILSCCSRRRPRSNLLRHSLQTARFGRSKVALCRCAESTWQTQSQLRQTSQSVPQDHKPVFRSGHSSQFDIRISTFLSHSALDIRH